MAARTGSGAAGKHSVHAAAGAVEVAASHAPLSVFPWLSSCSLQAAASRRDTLSEQPTARSPGARCAGDRRVLQQPLQRLKVVYQRLPGLQQQVA